MTTPLAAYPLDEGSGTTSADVAGGHTLTVNNAAWSASGHTGAALENTASNAGASATVPAITTPAVTLMAWVMPLDLAAGTTKFAVGVVQSNGNTDCALWTQRGNFSTSNVLQGNVRINGNLAAINGSALVVNTWNHLALTYDGTTIRLYKDGVQVATVNVTGTISLGTDFYVAGSIPAAGADSDNRDDEIRYYHAVLDQATIAALKDIPPSAGPAGAAALTATSALTVSATRAANASAALVGTASLTAGATREQPAAVALIGTGLLIAGATVDAPALAALVATSMLTPAGVLERVAAAALIATSSLIASATTDADAAAALVGTGSLAAGGTQEQSGAAALIGTGQLAAMASVDGPAAAALVGTATLAAAATLARIAVAALVGRGTLTGAVPTSAVDITVTFGPTRRRELVTFGPSRTGTSIGETRKSWAIGPSRKDRGN